LYILELHDLNFSPDVIKGDEVKKHEVRETCRTHWREGFGGKNWKKRET
jgi:hypothetical protein